MLKIFLQNHKMLEAWLKDEQEFASQNSGRGYDQLGWIWSIAEDIERYTRKREEYPYEILPHETRMVILFRNRLLRAKAHAEKNGKKFERYTEILSLLPDIDLPKVRETALNAEVMDAILSGLELFKKQNEQWARDTHPRNDEDDAAIDALADYHNQAILCGRIIVALEPYKEGESFLSQKRKRE